MASQSTTSLKLDDGVKGRLHRLAESRKRKPHWLMKEAIEQYLEREEKRQAFHDDAFKAWDSYRTTGLHLTGDEADAWLEKLADGQDIEPPACHD